MIEKLNAGLEKLNLNFSPEQISRLEQYISCVMEFNKTYNIMKASSEEELAVSHILDSLAAVSYLEKLVKEIETSGVKQEDIQIGDIGSGGGCPGIPLAIAFPKMHFTFVERMEKRCVFLSNTIRKLNISNVKVLCTQADLVPKESFHLEVFRAFHPFEKKIVKLLFNMLKKDGIVAAYKARSEKIAAEMEEVKVMVPTYSKIQLTVPFLEDHERNLVVFRKEAAK